MGKTYEDPSHLRLVCSISCGMPAEAFFGLLAVNGVTLLLDTRVARRYQYAGFADERDVSYLCSTFGIRYALAEPLMPTQEMRQEFHERFGDVPKAADRNIEAWTRYLEQYETLLHERRFLTGGSIRDALYGNDENVAVMCHCAHHDDCHRSIAVGIIGTYLPNVEVRILYPNGEAPRRASPRRYRLKPFPHAGLTADAPRRS